MPFLDSNELQQLKNKYDIIGNDAALNRALDTAVAVAKSDLAVLVTGESGVGKENIPKIIHQNSLRKNGKYFAVNCGAIAEGTIDSELFGHEKGSFTGAIEARKGYFEEADGGTLFLDEIGELPLASQAKLLRVLQDGEYMRVGSSKVSKTNVRVIAATNVNLQYAVAQGKFRSDLYYRLYGVNIYMPPLRERKGDIELLFRKFASDFSDKYKTQKITLSNDAIKLLISYRWPGNIRQLKNCSETVAMMESDKASTPGERRIVNAEALSKYIPHDQENTLVVPFQDHNGSISQDEKQEILNALLGLSSQVKRLSDEVNRLKSGSGTGYALPEDHDSSYSQVIRSSNITKHEPDSTQELIDDQQDFIPFEHPEFHDDKPETVFDVHEEYQDLQPKTIRENSQEMILAALKKHGGNRKKAAEELGISERTIYRNIPDEYKKRKHE